MSLTLQDSIDRLQQNEERLDQFVNDPAAAGTYSTRDGQPVPTVPALVEQIRQAAEALADSEGASRVGYSPSDGDATTVEGALRELEARPAPEDPTPIAEAAAAAAVDEHEAAADPHPQYADADALSALDQRIDSLEYGTFGRYTLATKGLNSQTVYLELAAFQIFNVDASGPVTLQFLDEPPAGRSMTVVITVSGASLVTLPASVQWASGEAPPAGGTKTVIVLLWTGSEWIGTVPVAL
ncbi:hypothetical protein [Roseovarius sp.]|uniref:hypothetical protein n=1 Tax=Roseovarius sp. TaxID=1486281 RepID=UPI003A978329